MPDLVYSLIQYVGDPVRREGLNVGVAVLEPGKRSLVRVDLRAHARISAAWPQLDKNLFFAFVRDLRHTLAATHQLYLAETAINAEGPTAALTSLSERLANQFRVTEPKGYVAESARVAVDHLFGRLVTSSRGTASRRRRYMTRSELRTEISEVLGLWLGARTDPQRPALFPNAEVEGAVASHQVDLVTYSGEETPEMLFFAAPLAGQQAPLIRDAIPTIVNDLRSRLPESEYFAVLGQPASEQGDSAELITRAVLGRVEGLRILALDELRSEFGIPGLELAPTPSEPA